MEYFKSFNDVLYKFGSETSTVATQDLSSYIDIIDQVKDDIAIYEKGHITEGMRPDQLSYALYDTTIYHWTFYLLNDSLRLQGWPLTAQELNDTVQREFPRDVLTTRTPLAGIFKEGQTITGSVSGSTGTVVHRNLDFGQLIIDTENNGFIAGEAVTSTPIGGSVQSIIIVSAEKEINAAHHYISNGSTTIVDIDPALGPGQLITEVTNTEYYRNENEKLRDIKVIRPNIIENLAASFKQGIRT